MFFDRELAETRLKDWETQLTSASLPSWSDLPNLPLYMDQVLLLLGQYLNTGKDDERSVTASIINNYVRMKIMPAPVKKKYTRIHLAYLIMICTLKQSLSISYIQKLIPMDITDDQVQIIYNDFTLRYREVAQSFAEQLSNHSHPVFHSTETANPVGAVAISAALMANLSQNLTELIVDCQKKSE